MAEERYRLDGVSAVEVEAEVDRLWKELQTDPVLRQQAEESGIDLDKVSGLNREEIIAVKHSGADLDPLVGSLIVAFAPAAAEVLAEIAKDLWKHIFLPRILQRKGEGTITPEDRE
ncbi:MAG TPA: hypothetical protein VFO63_17175 [Blastocatellia bacterium]|nr:hypothetical protein [Blastocatellia bacterium]